MNVFGRALEKRSKRKRLIGAVLFVCVFLLPLHIHSYTAKAELQKECSCLHGSRTQLGAIPDVAPPLPPLAEAKIALLERELFFSFILGLTPIRAPPRVYFL